MSGSFAIMASGTLLKVESDAIALLSIISASIPALRSTVAMQMRPTGTWLVGQLLMMNGLGTSETFIFLFS